MRNYVARLEADGGVEQTLNLNAIGAKIVATAIQPDGKILIGGLFKNILGVQRNNMARLNADGTLDQQFDPSRAEKSMPSPWNRMVTSW